MNCLVEITYLTQRGSRKGTVCSSFAMRKMGTQQIVRMDGGGMARPAVRNDLSTASVAVVGLLVQQHSTESIFQTHECLLPKWRIPWPSRRRSLSTSGQSTFEPAMALPKRRTHTVVARLEWSSVTTSMQLWLQTLMIHSRQLRQKI